MARVQHSKPQRRWGWAVAAALLALPTAAEAQGLFFLFGNPSPYEIERRLEASGYIVTGPLTMRGDVYLADVIVRGEGPERLVIDARSGAIVERFRGRPERWREAAAPPPPAWSDDPSLWNGPRPPAAIGPDNGPPDAFEPSPGQGPRVLEAPKAARPKAAETKPKWTPKPAAPVANVANPPPAVVNPVPAHAAPVAPPPASPTPSASALPASPTPAAASSPAPSLAAAKTEPAPAVVKPPPAPTAKPSKAVNDIPVTPLD